MLYPVYITLITLSNGSYLSCIAQDIRMRVCSREWGTKRSGEWGGMEKAAVANSISAPNEMSYAKHNLFCSGFIKLAAGPRFACKFYSADKGPF